MPDWRNRIIGYGMVDPRDLVANPRNWRTHPDAQRGALEGVLSDVGWVAEVLVNQRTGFVVDGHLRVASAVARHEPSVPVRYVDLDEAEERLVLATLDPISALATSSAEQLSALLEGLQPADQAVANLLRDLAPPVKKALNPDDADLTPPEEPVTQPGDLWLLGDHRLLCGDATDERDLVRVMDSNAPNMVFADPPYGISIVSGAGTLRSNTLQPFGGKRLGSVGGPKPFGSHVGTTDSPNMIDVGHYAPVIGDDSTDTALKAASLALRLWPKAVQVWWGANFYADSLPASSCWLVWDKDNTGNFGDAELAWTNQKTAVRLFRHMWNGLMKASERGERRVHPTQKPVALAEWCFQSYGGDADLVLDPFVGSGMSVIAAEQTGRYVYGLELAPAYCDVIVRRWERVSGRQAVKTHA